MSQFDKLLSRMLKVPGDFTYDEARSILMHLGYVEKTKGNSSGSRVAFVRGDLKILLHKPHNPTIMRRYQIEDLIEHLRGNGFIE